MEVAVDMQPEEGINRDNSPKLSSVPSTPLQQISPERLNQRVVQSPSVSLSLDQSARRSQHRGSDASEVKAKVAYLNAMSGSPVRSNSPTKPYHHASSHAAIQRAIVGREEAETALNAMTAQLESARARERLVSERVESLMEQLQEARNRQRHERQVYEKEVKISKKNEYKAELAVIKLQEEMKEVKNELDGFRARSDHDKNEKEKARQEAFERAYAVAGMTEELKTLKDRLQVVEQERDSAVATAAMKLEVPVKPDFLSEHTFEVTPLQDDIASRKRKQPMVDPFPDVPLADEQDPDDENCPIETKYAALQKHVNYLNKQVQESQDEIVLMKMQCQFEACPCRRAERNGFRYVHDYEYDRKLREQNAKKQKMTNERPLQPFMSFKSWQAERRKLGAAAAAAAAQESQPSSNAPPQATEKISSSIPAMKEEVSAENDTLEPAAPLPPVTSQADETQSSEQALEAEAAAQIPLPQAAEDTAQLEEFTQVVVNPTAVTQTLSVATATPFNHPPENLDIHSARSLNIADMSEELFNLSPPRRVPPRPSTAMGIVSAGSPIRIVQDPPQPRSACGDPPQILTHSQTTRVALNDESSRLTARSHHSSQSKAAVRSHSRGRSPGLPKDSRPNSALELASPASSTVFPLTPAKHPRKAPHKAPPSNNQFHAGRDVHQHQLPSTYTMNETTTTTSVPLRSEDDSFDLGTSQNSMSSESSRNSAFLKDTHNMVGTPISREAALAQIRARRDRARSVNMRKAEKEGASGENDRKGAKTPVSAARRGVKIDLGHRAGRDFSQASAPGRF